MSMSPENTTPLDTIHVGKARKKNGYYSCPIMSLNKRDPFVISFDVAQILDVKESSSTLIIKCKDMLPFMNGLSTTILSIVELNHENWFNSSIDDAYIEEMFVSPVYYDPKHGAVLRIRIKNLDEFPIESLIGKTAKMIFDLKNMMFARQKFFLIFKLHEIKETKLTKYIENKFVDENDDTDADEVETEDLTPTYDEVIAMKHDKLNELEEIRASLIEKIKHLSHNISFLTSCKSIPEILKACEEIANV